MKGRHTRWFRYTPVGTGTITETISSFSLTCSLNHSPKSSGHRLRVTVRVQVRMRMRTRIRAWVRVRVRVSLLN